MLVDRPWPSADRLRSGDRMQGQLAAGQGANGDAPFKLGDPAAKLHVIAQGRVARRPARPLSCTSRSLLVVTDDAAGRW